MKTLFNILSAIYGTVVDIGFTISQSLFIGLGFTLGVYCAVVFILRLHGVMS